jgi:hypothetical protein
VINRDTKVALFVLAVTVALYLSLSSIDPEATIFIRVVIVAIGALALLLMGQGMLLKHRGKGGGTSQGPASKKTGLAWKPVAVHFRRHPCVFFHDGAARLLCLGVCLFCRGGVPVGLEGLDSPEGFCENCDCFLFVAVIYLLFSVILQVQTPRGLLI